MDTSIILGIKPPQIMGADERNMNQLRLQQILQSNQANQMKMQEYQDKKTRANNVSEILKNNPNATAQDLARQGYLDEAKDYGGIETTGIANEGNRFKNNKEQLNHYTQGLLTVSKSQNPKQDAANFITESIRFGTMKPEIGQQLLGQLEASTDDQVRQGALQMFKQTLDADKQLPKNAITDSGSQLIPTSQDAITGAVTQAPGIINKAIAPDALVDNKLQASQFLETKRHNMATEAQSNAGDSSAGGITPEAIMGAAERYRIDGTMPALGMGKSAGAVRTAILNKAAELDATDGIGAKDARGNQISGKATTSGLTQLQKQKNMVSAFEKNAQKNGQMALRLSDEVDRTGVPILNKWIQAGQKAGTGDPKLSQFHAANETFVNEYAKIMSGSMGNTAVSDSAREHAHSLLSTAQTKEQYKAVMQTLNQEMQNRMQGFDEEIAATRESLGGSKKSDTGNGIPAGWAVEAH